MDIRSAEPQGSVALSARRFGRRFLLDLIFAALLAVLAIYGVLYVNPVIAGTPAHPQRWISVLLAALWPAGSLVLVSFIERLLPAAGPRKSAANWFLHLQINLFYTFMAGIAAGVTFIVTGAIANHFGFKLGLIDLQFASGRSLLAMFGAVWVAAVAGDFFFYWFHRALHKVPVLWAHHKMHHMDETLEAVTVTRQNWIEVFIAAVLIFIPMRIMFKVDSFDLVQLGLLSGAFVTIFSNLLGLGHMNVRLQVGRASVIFCSPQVHRIHHSRLPQHRDKNFAFILPLWDVLFGTYCAPQRDEFPPTGVEGEGEIHSFWESQIYTQREWWRMFKRWRQRRAGGGPS
jgi:sterol desaturase/sphingolipid hydroxylase (fatty acid hydroxylase superfamily)